MRPRFIIAAVLFVAGIGVSTADAQVASAGAPSQKVALPDTPAGRAAREWLDAFNSADSAALAAWAGKYSLDRPIGGQLAFRRETGGFDLVSVETSEPRLRRIESIYDPTNLFRLNHNISPGS